MQKYVFTNKRNKQDGADGVSRWIVMSEIVKSKGERDEKEGKLVRDLLKMTKVNRECNRYTNGGKLLSIALQLLECAQTLL